MPRDRRILYVGIMAIGILLPLVLVVAALAGPILGLGFIVAGIAGVGVWPTLRAVDRRLRRSRAEATARTAREAHIMALDMDVPEVAQIRAPGKTFEAEIVSAEGVCPLLRRKGDIWKVDADGRLGAPMCSPSAAAIARLIREGASASGTAERCVCPLGQQWVTYQLAAA